MENPSLDDEDTLNLEYRSSAGFRNFFRMSTLALSERILNMIAPILKPLTHHMPPQKLILHYRRRQISTQQTFDETATLPIEFSCRTACHGMQKPCLSRAALTSTFFRHWPHGKAAFYRILLRDIVWTHLYTMPLPFIGDKIWYWVNIIRTFHFMNNWLIWATGVVVISVLIFNSEYFGLASNE